ncbi:MAG: T9SS type A sorting domain-containing protein [candidate division Zixibacteria bacterium]|nr:T9SS type A sorting domain-containing protein [candidate division Zixibacteria bacterium]
MRYPMNHNYKSLILAIAAVFVFANVAAAGPADIRGELLAYDGDPSIILYDYNGIGDEASVRFTAAQSCSLLGVQLTGFGGEADIILHVRADNGGEPGDDLVSPYNLTLNGNLQRQNVPLTPPAVLPAGDFHVSWELTEAGKPIPTTDSDGNTEDRSMARNDGGAWTVLPNDVNTRAYVQYFEEPNEGVIMYDGDPQYFLTEYDEVGTQFAVRFTNTRFPDEKVTVDSLALYTTMGSGSGVLKVWADDGGNPGGVLHNQNVNLNGNYQWQTIALDTPIEIIGTDFHAGWELNQDGQPIQSTDGNDNIEQRSKVNTPSGDWTALQRNMNIRAWVTWDSLELMELVYSEDFDDQEFDWRGDWDITDEHSNSPQYSYTDSPDGNYPNDANLEAELITAIDLSQYFGAIVKFWTKYDIETGFDYVYMYASKDDGDTWNLLHTFNGEGVDWHEFQADIGGYAGGTVKFKFNLVTDGAYVVDGMYIDDFEVYGSVLDLSPPLILYDAPDDTVSIPGAFELIATITDPSDVEDAILTYWVDEGNPTDLEPTNIVDDEYYFTIPQVEAGAHVYYYITATDTEGNTGSTAEFHYVSGSVIYYDDDEPEFYTLFADDQLCATRFTPDDPAILVTGLMRFYRDSNHEHEYVDIHVWDVNGGNPGDDMITPFEFFPQSTLEDPEAWSYIDFRGMDIEVTEDFFLGAAFRDTIPAMLMDDLAPHGRSLVYVNGAWAPTSGELHTRVVVDYGGLSVDDENGSVPTEFAIRQNYPNPFNAVTSIGYTVSERTNVSLEVFNLMGQKVATLIDEPHQPGVYSVKWDASETASGVYFYRMSAGDEILVRKMILLK